MNIHEETLKIARNLIKKDPSLTDWVISKFPELKENKDEKMRKGIIRNLEYLMDRAEGFVKDELKERIAWLEKQGGGNFANSAKTCKDEQTTADKAGHKFHEGEWLCENEPNNYARFIQILETVNVQGKERYRISRDIHNDEDIVEFDFVENYYHKFDIKDAKDGDVLVCEDFGYTSLMLFKSFSNGRISLHCWYNSQTNNFHINTDVALRKDANIYPATKEQRDTLEKAMADAGWKFDFDKKELKKIEQKPSWNKENEKEVAVLEAYIRSRDWSDRHIDRALGIVDELVKKLKSLIPQKQWKPSEEQMKFLKKCIEAYNEVTFPTEVRVLSSLYNDLKKLREE